MTKEERFRGCIIGGAIGDAWGSGFENQFEEDGDTFYFLGNPNVKMPTWGITDDTQLTLATIEVMCENKKVNPEVIANKFVEYYQQRKLRGIGASTLKSLKELSFGGHWSQVGRRGEYAAGNGAAMRIAPIAFREEITYSEIRDICIITHNNDEAYIGAKSVIIAIREILNGNWNGTTNLLELIIDQIPDTRVRDRLIEIKNIENLLEIGKIGNDGYVVNSVPLAIAAANKVKEIGIEQMYAQLIEIGGDTDTNCSIAGQIAGSLIGFHAIPIKLTSKLETLQDYNWITTTMDKLIALENW
ncbi:ADP-ribosylglycohydrolase family protein [uncultured Tenacibaculum sp.]|uniref:ADP-ribosylglycohydrolase family protein n=1 Tax=uncultured Tenacibaculum sp. TaxID=174713 RepID=UPI00260C6B4B|nr:ADP-ribosylglycohydrolase family protein [uncultured Tenacibaculum sp.]